MVLKWFTYPCCCLSTVLAGMGVFSFARYDDNFYSRSYAGRLKKRLQPKQGDYSVFDGYYTPPITSTLLLRSCKVSYKHAPPLTQFWYYELLSGLAKGPLLLWILLITTLNTAVFCVCYQNSLMLNISFQVMTHEIGHMFGIKHCQWLNCVMQGSNHLEESDRRPLDFCPICLRKIQVAIGFNLAERYKVKTQTFFTENKEEPWFW